VAVAVIRRARGARTDGAGQRALVRAVVGQGTPLGDLIRAAAQGFARVAAQSEADRARIAQLYLGPIDVLGNLKFDSRRRRSWLSRAEACATAWGRDRSGYSRVHAMARRRCCSMHSSRCASNGIRPHPVDRAAPPQRFDEVARLIEDHGFTCARRSTGALHAPPATGTILLGDSMGEMAMYTRLPTSR